MNIVEILTIIGVIFFGVLLIKLGLDTINSIKKFQ